MSSRGHFYPVADIVLITVYLFFCLKQDLRWLLFILNPCLYTGPSFCVHVYTHTHLMTNIKEKKFYILSKVIVLDPPYSGFPQTCFIQASSCFFPFISWFWTPSFTTFVSSPGLDNGFASWGMSPQHSQGIFDLFLLAPHTSGHLDKYHIQMSAWITQAALLLGSKSESYGLRKVLCHCTHFAKCTRKGGLTTIKKKDTIQRHSQNWISTQGEKKR